MIAGWIILSILCGFLASSNGRSGVGYFFLSLLLSPLIGFIAVLIAGEDKEELENTKIASRESKKCPDCAESIKFEAKVCRYCGKEQDVSIFVEKMIDPKVDFSCDCGNLTGKEFHGKSCTSCKSIVNFIPKSKRKNNLSEDDIKYSCDCGNLRGKKNLRKRCSDCNTLNQFDFNRK